MDYFRIDLDPETSTSSFLEESDNSSIQRSPTNSHDGDSSHPRTLHEALEYRSPPIPGSNVTPLRGIMRTSNNPGDHSPTKADTLQVPQFRITSPDQDRWYTSGGGRRTPSPVSPRISPSPKALKAATTQDLHIRITQATPERRSSQHERPIVSLPGAGSVLTEHRNRSSSAHRRANPSPNRMGTGHYREAPNIPQTLSGSVNTLSVPPRGSRDNRDSESNSSMSSYYPSSSRSASGSPMTPDTPDSPWLMDPTRAGGSTPHKHPVLPPRSKVNAPDNMDHRTSSMQRPLGIRQQDTTLTSSVKGQGHEQSPGQGPSANAPRWQKERWKHWEKIAKENSDEFHEQETLV